MKTIALISLSTLCLSILSACSGEGGMTSVRGEQCSSTHKPVSMSLKKGEVELKLDDVQRRMPVGKYVFMGSDLYYIETKTDFRIHMQDQKQKDGGFKNKIVCLRNADPSLTGVNLKVEGISSMEIDGIINKDPLIAIREFTLSIIDSKIDNKASSAKDPVPTAPKTVYSKSTVLETHLVKIDSRNYEIRSRGVSADGRGTYTLAVKIKRQAK